MPIVSLRIRKARIASQSINFKSCCLVAECELRSGHAIKAPSIPKGQRKQKYSQRSVKSVGQWLGREHPCKKFPFVRDGAAKAPSYAQFYFDSS